MFDNAYQQAICRYGLELEEGAAMTVKTIFENDEAKLAEGDGAVIISLRAWGHSSSIKTEIWMRLVQAWLESREGLVAPHGEVWTVSKDRLKLFLKEADGLSYTFTQSSVTRVVKLRKVKELLTNLASGKAPDAPHPPSWAGKDVVGYLLRRGWKITEDGDGLQRRGFFIPADLIETAKGGSESTADCLESEGAQRTDREFNWGEAQNPDCPYPGQHHPTCDCKGMGGPR